VDIVAGTLASKPNTTYRIDFHYGITCSQNAPGRGLAMGTLQWTTVTTGGSGVAPFSVTVRSPPPSFPAGGISATATDAAGNTSELGNCVQETLDSSDILFKDGFEQ
jgi:hypothetical protein